MDHGIVVGGELADLGSVAALAEDGGFESVWCAETARSAFTQAAVACEATSRARVGTAVALAFPRSPAITAMTARDLAELSEGRFILGLGSQVKRVNEQRFSVPFEHPAPKMEDYVKAVRAVLASFGGAAPDHHGPFYSITMSPFPGAGPPRERIPIYLAAVNERMAEVAGRVADGVVGHPMTSPEYVSEVLRPAIERGARAAGRDPGEVNVTTNLIVQVGNDGEEARREAAYQVAFYATTRTYRPVLALHGFEDLIDPLREAHGRGDLAAMGGIARPMVGTLAVGGTPDEVRERVSQFGNVVDRVILSGAWIGPSPERVRNSYRLLLETFGHG
jgi:probable F420-dependent oxidoreductase